MPGNALLQFGDEDRGAMSCFIGVKNATDPRVSFWKGRPYERETVPIRYVGLLELIARFVALGYCNFIDPKGWLLSCLQGASLEAETCYGYLILGYKEYDFYTINCELSVPDTLLRFAGYCEKNMETLFPGKKDIWRELPIVS